MPKCKFGHDTEATKKLIVEDADGEQREEFYCGPHAEEVEEDAYMDEVAVVGVVELKDG